MSMNGHFISRINMCQIHEILLFSDLANQHLPYQLFLKHLNTRNITSSMWVRVGGSIGHKKRCFWFSCSVKLHIFHDADNRGLTIAALTSLSNYKTGGQRPGKDFTSWKRDIKQPAARGQKWTASSLLPRLPIGGATFEATIRRHSTR